MVRVLYVYNGKKVLDEKKDKTSPEEIEDYIINQR